MRKFFYIIPLLLTAFVFLESCICSTTNTKSSFTSLSIPINVIWSETSYIDYIIWGKRIRTEKKFVF